MPLVPLPRTPEIAEDILRRFEGGELLAEIAESYNAPYGDWYGWCDADPELKARWEKAKRIGYDAMAENVVRVVDSEPRLTTVLNSKLEVLSERVDTGYVAWQKARFDARTKMLGFWARDRYGDQQRHEVATPVGRPFQTEDARDPATLALAIAAALRAKKRDEPDEDFDIEDLI